MKIYLWVQLRRNQLENSNNSAACWQKKVCYPLKSNISSNAEFSLSQKYFYKLSMVLFFLLSNPFSPCFLIL